MVLPVIENEFHLIGLTCQIVCRHADQNIYGSLLLNTVLLRI
jgi:hypothetical protein